MKFWNYIIIDRNHFYVKLFKSERDGFSSSHRNYSNSSRNDGILSFGNFNNSDEKKNDGISIFHSFIALSTKLFQPILVDCRKISALIISNKRTQAFKQTGGNLNGIDYPKANGNSFYRTFFLSKPMKETAGFQATL